MEENDSRPQNDETGRFQETEEVENHTSEIYIEGDDEDVHVCRKCNIAFNDIQLYLEHKIKHDNYKVKYCRSEVDKRRIVPKLVQKIKVKREAKVDVTLDDGSISVSHGGLQDEEKENEQQKPKRRGRKRGHEMMLDPDLVITEKPVYICEKCDRKFNRAATLRRHNEYEHGNDDDNDDENDDLDYNDDRDEDYDPKHPDIKDEIARDKLMERQMETETAVEGGVTEEMDSLDQVIMAAALMEQQQEVGSQVTMVTGQCEGSQGQQMTQTGGVAQSVTPTVVKITPGVTVSVARASQKDQGAGETEQFITMTEEDKGARKYACHICGNKFKEMNVLKTHMLTHNPNRDFVCTFSGCTYSFKTRGCLKRHIRRHTGERPYPCELCGRTFTESGALTRHLKSRTTCTKKSDNDLPRYGKKWMYTPNIPAAQSKPATGHVNPLGGDTPTFSRKQHIKKDYMIQPVPEMSAAVVSNIDGSGEPIPSITTVVQILSDTSGITDQFDLDQPENVEIVIGSDDVTNAITQGIAGDFVETETVITEERHSTVCKVCNEDLLDIEALRVHLRTHLADHACKCWLCHFMTESKEEFEQHMFLHHHVQLKSYDPYTNLMPPEGAISTTEPRDKVEIHRDAQLAVKQLLELPSDVTEPPVTTDVSDTPSRTMYKCPVCWRRFRGSNYLKLHMRNHTGLRPHKCSLCEKSFITKDTLNKHLASHQDDRNFKCGECGKLFKRLSHVREHIKIHSGSRPYPCTICDKTFKTNNAMKVHLRTHTDILPYECNYCHRRFREKGSVIRHKRLHTGEKPFECRHCGRCFSEHGTLNRHLKAKVPCTGQVQELGEKGDTDYTVRGEDGDYTVLAEFSSVVADTQQYIMPEEGGDDALGHGEMVIHEGDPQQAPEFVVLHTNNEDEQIQNVEVITGDDGQTSTVEGFQVTDDYIVITDPNGGGMRILDSATGETVAIVPVSSEENTDNQIQTITMSQDGEISTMTLTPNTEVVTEDTEIEGLINEDGEQVFQIDEADMEQIMEDGEIINDNITETQDIDTNEQDDIGNETESQDTQDTIQSSTSQIIQLLQSSGEILSVVGHGDDLTAGLTGVEVVDRLAGGDNVILNVIQVDESIIQGVTDEGDGEVGNEEVTEIREIGEESVETVEIEEANS